MRFLMRIHDPLKQWKLSAMDLESRRRWEHYTYAKEEMFQRTHIPEARWWVIEGVDKKRARLKCIHHLLQQIPLWGRSPRTNRNAGTGASAGLRAPPGSQGDVCAGGVLVSLFVRHEANEISCPLLLWQSTARVNGRPRHLC
jgi:hypothetical protein